MSMEEKAELTQVNNLIAAALKKTSESKNFTLKWKSISAVINLLPACLSELSSHPCLPKLPLYRQLLQSICQTLTRAIDLAESQNLGKLETQSQLHSLSSLLHMNIRDCKLLAKTAVLGDFSTWEILARIQIGQADAKICAMEALLEAAMSDEKRISSVLSRSHASSLVHLLNSSPSPKLEEKTVMAVCLLSCSRNSAEVLVSEGVILPLLRLAKSSSIICKNKAVISLQRLSLLPDAAHSIVSHGGGKILIEICRDEGYTISLVAAAGTLKNLSAISELQVVLAREGILKVMLRLLESAQQPPECRDHAAECLQNLTSGRFGSATATATLPKLLSFIDETAAPAAVAAVANLAGILPPAALVPAELVPRLTRILQRGSPAAQRLAANALQKASSRSNVIKRLAGESGCILLLLNLLSGKTENELKHSSASAMASLLQHLPNMRAAKKDTRAVPCLVSLLSTSASEHAILCLSALSASRNSRKAMISFGAIGKLSAMAATPNSLKLLARLQQGG